MGVESCWNKQAGVCCCKSEKGCVAYKAPPHVLSWADSRDIQSHNSTMPGGMIMFTKSLFYFGHTTISTLYYHSAQRKRSEVEQ